MAVSTWTNTTSNDLVGTTTATREVAGTEEVTGVVTSTSTASATSTKGGVLTDYRYALYAEAGPDSAWAASNPLTDGEYYTPATDYEGGTNADGDDIVYIATDDAIASNVEVITEAVPASEEVYVVDIIEPVPVTLPDTIYVEETTVSVATRTKLAD